MAKNAIPAPPRPRLLPKVIWLTVLALIMVAVVRHPADAAEWMRGAATWFVTAVDMLSEFIRAVAG
ncbi:hypothetical protein SAMN06265360_101322 [Haloechinothrix alba]|uniref:Uncharacterized protein n=1 Tax=Haloechinothrix alba TaxID=664784 RepID=A0A238V5F0_9PSEU|nr:hypothetical protein [Haloechinothrix alba]SNR29217.1 hypothetical protein SAMN06265360_101322 [Haloechinothrix alba]